MQDMFALMLKSRWFIARWGGIFHRRKSEI